MNLVLEDQAKDGTDGAHHHAHHAQGHAQPGATTDKAAEMPAGTIYTCPMYPEVQQDHPGNCPKCGMSLEPIIPLDAEDNSELKDFQRRFGVVAQMPVAAEVGSGDERDELGSG